MGAQTGERCPVGGVLGGKGLVFASLVQGHNGVFPVAPVLDHLGAHLQLRMAVQQMVIGGDEVLGAASTAPKLVPPFREKAADAVIEPTGVVRRVTVTDARTISLRTISLT